MRDAITLVMDCGATNVRTIAVNQKGEMIAQYSFPNQSKPQSDDAKLRYWDVDEIWNKMIQATQHVVKQIDAHAIQAITVTTFGVDGAPLKKNGELLYPVISWQCPRTLPIMENIDAYIPLRELYAITGLQPMHFNTISKLIWYKENHPDILDAMDYYVFISSIFLQHLCGEWITDTSMAGTSMLTDLTKRGFSDTILDILHISPSLFPTMVEPGEVVGTLTDKACNTLGIPNPVKVVAAGHDTQFAIFGSGAEINEPVLSSGTWEILMVRTNQCRPSDTTLAQGLTIEYDPIPGLLNPGLQWIGSGALEWVKNMFYSQEQQTLDNPALYQQMIQEAENEPAGSHGVFMHPNFAPGSGPSRPYNTHGSILGLTMHTQRSSIYRAMLEAMACQTREALDILESVSQFKAERLLCVGGGSKNRLWNQLRADFVGIPIKPIEQAETTVLGAAFFAMAGAGIFASAEEARTQILSEGTMNANHSNEIHPSTQNQTKNEEIYMRFKTLAKNLAPIYT